MPEAIRNVVDLFVQEIRNVMDPMPEVIIGKAQMWMLWY